MIFDIGNIVICDNCGDDHTLKDVPGGIVLLNSSGCCPSCSESLMADIEKYNETDSITHKANVGESFRHFILRIRNGNNKVFMTSIEM